VSAVLVRERFVPCPICHGQGGETEAITDDGTGPYYPCGGCSDIGTVWAYKRGNEWNAVLWARREAAMCVCGHNAAEHYPGHDRCAWESVSDDNRLETCPCLRSLEAVMRAPDSAPGNENEEAGR
jgi:hypothetical protein